MHRKTKPFPYRERLCLLLNAIFEHNRSFIARMIDRYPWLNLVGAAILVHTAMEMFFKDKYVRDIVHMDRPLELGVILLIVLAVVALGWHWNKRAEEAARSMQATQHHRSVDATESGS